MSRIPAFDYFAASPIGRGVARAFQPPSPPDLDDDDVVLHIEKTYSTDHNVGMLGYVVPKRGALTEAHVVVGERRVRIAKWTPRPDIVKQYARYPVPEACGFAVSVPRLAQHEFTFELAGMAPKTVVRRGYKPEAPLGYPANASFDEFTRAVNKNHGRILEIGARQVSNASRRQLFHGASKYVGFDLYPDSNVDVTGDAHRLSSYFGAEEFDAVFSDSVFEHLALPWVVAMEVNRILKPGGLVYTSTPSAWPLHERPWDFWRFTDHGLKILFSRPFGFEMLGVGLHAPVQMCLLDTPETGTTQPEELPFGHCFANVAILARKVGPVARGIRWEVDMKDFLDGDTTYPVGTSSIDLTSRDRR